MPDVGEAETGANHRPDIVRTMGELLQEGI